jgi:ATP-dependent Lon protease
MVSDEWKDLRPPGTLHRNPVTPTSRIPRSNRKDLWEIPKPLRKEVEVILADKVTDVLRHALT